MNGALIDAPAWVIILDHAVVYALADAWAGGHLGWKRLSKDQGGRLGGKPTYYIALPMIANGWLLGGPWLAGTALAWLIYRGSFPWKLFGVETMKPDTFREALVTMVRHWIWGMIMGVAGVVAIINHVWAPMTLPAGLFLYAGGATALALAYAREIYDVLPGPDAGPWATRLDKKFALGRGALAGIMAAATWVGSL